MKIKNYSVHRIDLSESEPKNITNEVTNSDFDQYLIELINLIFKDPNSREFHFQRATTEIRVATSNILEEKDFNTNSNVCAERLLIEEIKAQKGIEHMGKSIQHGVLIQALFKNHERNHFLICKAEHSEFLDDIRFKKTTGLPMKKKIFKAYFVETASDNSISKVTVFDTNSVMSKYWWREYLELAEIYDSTENTKNSFKSLESRIFNPLKKQSLVDYTYLRNSAVKYYRSTEDFSIEGFIEFIFDNYDPVEKTLQIDKIKDKVRDLPTKYGFDPRFPIDKSAITAKMKKTYHLTNEIDLVLKANVEIGETIKPYKDDAGRKFLRIRSDGGYDAFSREMSK